MQTFSVTPEFRHCLEPAPDAAMGIPSMMSKPERSTLYHLAKSYYSGAGVVVDAGLFLGGSTRALGEGLKSNINLAAARQKFGKPIRSFELGIVNPGMPAFFDRHGIGQGLKAGDSFAPLLEAHIKPVEDVVSLTLGDILNSPPVTEPIELLFIDVIKLPVIGNFCFQRFFPRLIPGRSIVIQQDYFIDQLPYLKSMQERFADHFEYIGELASSAVFRLIKPLSQSEVDSRLSAELDPAEELRLADLAQGRSIDPDRRFLMGLSKARMIVSVKGRRRAAAREYLDQLERDYPEQAQKTKSVRLKAAHKAVRDYCEAKPKKTEPTTAAT